ncbi:hypothetical protein FBUS_02480 [Fasciolopsis buskii]|uniref:Uncharacterized protein n=1 Tax=Fasciolopsis buskii TaxID=27845 RepID=A0A8E0VK65_9TREM|nr:hypothetical protein FBUS_02480 [Fasciolopsis buski]
MPLYKKFVNRTSRVLRAMVPYLFLTYVMTTIAASEVPVTEAKTTAKPALINRIAQMVSSVQGSERLLWSTDPILYALTGSSLGLLLLILFLLICLLCCTTCYVSQDTKNGHGWFFRRHPSVGGEC